MRPPSLPALLSLSVFLFATPASAQRIHGVLIEDGTGAPIAAGAVLLLDEAGEKVIARAFSDTLGVFVLDADRAGTYRLRAERLGYQTSTTEPFETVVRQVLRVELRLSTAAVLLDPLEVVSASRPSYAWGKLAQFYDNKEYYHDKLGMGHVFTRDEIAKHQPLRTSDLMRRVAGLRVRPHPSQPGRAVVRSVRRVCSYGFRVYVDGVRFGSADEYLDHISPHELEGVEVYTGFVPDTYRDPCVIALWTRRGR